VLIARVNPDLEKIITLLKAYVDMMDWNKYRDPKDSYKDVADITKKRMGEVT
jgi:hypothetical protein